MAGTLQATPVPRRYRVLGADGSWETIVVYYYEKREDWIRRFY